MLQEFKEFALRGNVVDMAVGKSSAPPFRRSCALWSTTSSCRRSASSLAGSISPTCFIALNGEHYPSLAAARQVGAATINFGLFINNVISFSIVAFVLFMAIKGMNQLRRKQEEDPQSEPPPSREVQLLEEIRDALVKRG